MILSLPTHSFLASLPKQALVQKGSLFGTIHGKSLPGTHDMTSCCAAYSLYFTFMKFFFLLSSWPLLTYIENQYIVTKKELCLVSFMSKY